MVRVGAGSIAAAFAALTIGISFYAGLTHSTGLANAGLRAGARGVSAVGTNHPNLFDRPTATLESDVPDSFRLRLASLDTGYDSRPAFGEPDNHSTPAVRSSFGERFSFDQASLPSRSLQPSQPAASFDDRFNGMITEASAPVRSAADAPRVPAPRVAAAAPPPAPRAAARSVLAQAAPKRAAGTFQLASASDTPLPTAYAPADARNDPAIPDSVLRDLTPKDSNPLAGVDTGRTAIYDITAHTVYLPDGQRLEAHSGLGGHMDDPRYVDARSTGPTPPNVYKLTLRERIFHGVRAIRLNPVDGGKMHGRDGMLAHSYMLGPNGQSNGCVSFDDYPAFLSAFLRGDVDRLVVVEHLADVPAPKTASGWIANTLKDIFGRS